MHLLLLISSFLGYFQAAPAVSDFICPVMGEHQVAAVPAVEYRGVSYGFCCAQCPPKFAKNPETYIGKSDSMIGTSLFNPVTGKRILEAESKASADYRGIRFFFENDEQKAEFIESPELYYVQPEKESMTCPIKHNAISKYSSAAGYADYEGVRYYFCCPGCDAEFEKDPAKAAASVKGKVRSALHSGQTADAGSQKLMPTCAGCAGEAKLMGANGVMTTWTAAFRAIAINDPKARYRFTLDYAVTPRLSVGIERSGSDSSTAPVKTNGIDNYLRYSDGDTPILPRASWFATPERGALPSVVLGMASDRLSTPRGQAFFATFAHTIKGAPIYPFVSVKTNSFDGRTVFPFGVNVMVKPDWTIQAINDGDYTHLLLTHVGNGRSTSLILARSRYIGVSMTFGF